jgi:hypothetical protein
LISQNDCIALLNKLVFESVFSNFDSQNLANSVWAFATLKIYHEDLFVKVSQQCVIRRFAQFCAQEIANLLWSFATLGISDQNCLLLLLQNVYIKEW